MATNCSDGWPDCSTTFTQSGTCGGNAALGPADGNSWQLNTGDNIVIGFRCSTITEVGPGMGDLLMHSPDFQIFGTSTDPTHTIVEVSIDNTNFYSVNLWGQLGGTTNPLFDLMYTTMASSTTMPLEVARYVRVTMAGSGTAEIDAVESLRAIK